MEQENNSQNIIIYNTPDGKASVSLFAKDGMVWMNQTQIAELFDTSVPNISMHISNILREKVKYCFSYVGMWEMQKKPEGSI